MKIVPKRAKDQFNLGLCWSKSQVALTCPGSGWFTVNNHGTGLYLSISFMAHPCHFGMKCRAGCDHSASQGGFTIQDKFSPGHMRKAILKLFAYSFPFSVHFFFQIILWLSNRTDNYYFSECTHLITFQIKWQLRLLAGKTEYQYVIPAVHISCHDNQWGHWFRVQFICGRKSTPPTHILMEIIF